MEIEVGTEINYNPSINYNDITSFGKVRKFGYKTLLGPAPNAWVYEINVDDYEIEIEEKPFNQFRCSINGKNTKFFTTDNKEFLINEIVEFINKG
jgi:hypothetical protein